MKEKLLNILPKTEKLLLAASIFMMPLVFFTDLTQNPFIAQDLSLALALCAFLACRALKFALKGEINLKFSKTDIALLAFAAVSLLSFFVNLFVGGRFLSLVGDFAQKGDVFVFAWLGGWFLAKTLEKGSWEKFSPNFYINVLFWAVGWIFFNVFGGFFFWVYAAFMWAWAGYICVKRLEKPTFFAAADIFLAVCALASFYGILQNAGLETFWKININYEFGSRAVSTFGNPNFLSSYLIIFLPFAFLRFFKAKSGGEQFTFFTLLMLFSAYLAISMTRSSWLGAGIGAAVLFLFKDFRALIFKGKKKSFFTAVCFFLVFLCWPSASADNGKKYSPAAKTRIAELNNLKTADSFGLNAPAEKLNPAYHQRLMMWACGFEMFKQAPLLGKGFTSFQTNYGLCQGGLLYKNPALANIKIQANEAHNQFVQVLAESGILGLASFLILLFFGFSSFKKVLRAEKNADVRLLYICLFAGLISFIVDNLLNITFRAMIPAFAFWFIFGALNNLSCAEKNRKLNKIGAFFLVLSAFLFSVLAAFWQIAYFRAEILAFKGQKLFAKKEYAAAVEILKTADKNSAVRAEPAFTIVNALIALNRYEEALAYSLRGIKKFPGYYEFYFRASGVESGLGNNAAAADYLKQALALYPENLSAVKAWAKFVIGMPHLRTAENAVLAQSLLKFFPHEDDLILAAILCGYSAGDKQSACSAAGSALDFDLLNPDYYEIFKLCRAEGLGEESLLEKASAVRAARDEVKKLKYTPELEAKIKQLSSAYPENPTPALLAAELRFNRGEYASAAAVLAPYYDKFKYLKPLCFALSSAYYKAGDYSKAKEPLLFILSYDKYNEQALARLKNMENL